MASSSLRGPGGYVLVREEARSLLAQSSRQLPPQSPPSSFVRVVENRPYFPLLEVDPSNTSSVLDAAISAVTWGGKGNGGEENGRRGGSVATITGGLTNALFRADLPPRGDGTVRKSVLVRIFGADGMIDRDAETTDYARLCRAIPPIIGGGQDLVARFANGRVEAWIPNARQAHHADDLKKEGLMLEVARQMARLHYGFCDCTVGREAGPSLWRVIRSWIEDLEGKVAGEEFRDDAGLAELFSSATGGTSLLGELGWIRDAFETHHPDAPVAFCHNDVNAGNLLLDVGAGDGDGEGAAGDGRRSPGPLCIIDYEYAAPNYAMYDVANYLCEHCGGNDNGIPDRTLLPSPGRVEAFLREYLRERDRASSGEGTPRPAEVRELRDQAQMLRMASDLFWGTWGVLQAAGEVSDGTFRREDAQGRMEGTVDTGGWDNLRYGRNRLRGYLELKESLFRGGG